MATAKGVVFGERGARRIVEAVRKVERFRVAGTKTRRPLLNSFDGLFPVKVEKTGGSDGSASTAASWTYTVRRVDWTAAEGQVSADYEIATAASPKMYGSTTPFRPFGKVTFQTGDQGYGTGFYDGGAFVLWSAGERFGTGTC